MGSNKKRQSNGAELPVENYHFSCAKHTESGQQAVLVSQIQVCQRKHHVQFFGLLY